jgi:hypothetical protein
VVCVWYVCVWCVCGVCVCVCVYVWCMCVCDVCVCVSVVGRIIFFSNSHFVWWARNIFVQMVPIPGHFSENLWASNHQGISFFLLTQEGLLVCSMLPSLLVNLKTCSLHITALSLKTHIHTHTVSLVKKLVPGKFLQKWTLKMNSF